ncbi:hypothetical protein [Gordonia soli]|uniref:Mce-associated membrane protein n=1 Tax=Gordonia soli NBRC 108243 TaxID=1223545 RepID=M0QHN7_9ACTN|nr:hypothetical protein [Gordonia soli]GAC68068.1 hypothetical protein GS4_11_03400 [Gordonia soli NBRC 108243]
MRARITTGRLIGATLAVLVVAAAVVATFLGIRYSDSRATEDARTSALESARQYATTMFGYNPQNVSQHIEASMDVLTGDAKPTYDDLITKNNLAAEVRKQQVVSEVTIQDAGVVTNTKDTAEVLIFMNQSVTRSNKELVRVDPSRLTFTMQRDGNRWLVNGIDVITDDSFKSRAEQADTPPPGAVPAPTVSQPSTSAPAPASGANPALPVPSPAPGG